jgi:hypothetical protein
MGKKLYGALLGLTITCHNDPKNAKVVVIVFKTLKSDYTTFFSDIDVCLR